MSKRGAEKGEPKLPAPSDATTVLPPAVRNGRVARRPHGQVQGAAKRWRNKCYPRRKPCLSHAQSSKHVIPSKLATPQSLPIICLYDEWTNRLKRNLLYGIRYVQWGNLPSGQKAHGFQTSIAAMSKCPSVSYYWVSFQGQSTVLPVTPTGLSVEKHHLPLLEPPKSNSPDGRREGLG